MNKIEIVGVPSFSEEDNGMAIIAEVSDERDVFVRIHSWNQFEQHPAILSFVGKKVKVTIEEIE